MQGMKEDTKNSSQLGLILFYAGEPFYIATY